MVGIGSCQEMVHCGQCVPYGLHLEEYKSAGETEGAKLIEMMAMMMLCEALELWETA